MTSILRSHFFIKSELQLSKDMQTIKTIIFLAVACILSVVRADEITKLRPVIKEVAAQHKLDPVLMEAIMRHESGHGKSKLAKNKNNLAGIMGRKGPRSYSSKSECVKHLGSILAKYKANGRVTVHQIGKKYCRTGGWATKVMAHMRAIKAGKHN